MKFIAHYFSNNRSLLIIYYCTILTLCSIYAAQPIQPLFQHEFLLSQLQATLFTSLMMLPLGLAPLFYGYVLEVFCTKRMISLAILLLGILEIIFAFSTDYIMLLTLRALQGLIIPAILTGLMSYISITSKREDIQHAIALYIGATIIGGFLGRFLSGFFTDLYGWRVFFFILGFLLIGAFFLLRHLETDGRIVFNKPKLSEISGLLANKQFLFIYLIIFFVFFVFAAVLNFLPFELKKLNPELSETGVGFVYFGYIMGLLISLLNKRILKLFTHEMKIVLWGILIFMLGTAGFFIADYQLMFFSMFIFCTGMFSVHTVLSGFLNTLLQDNKALANGLYLSFYYTGGALGSFVPGIFYKTWGWDIFLLILLVILSCAMFLSLSLKRYLDNKSLTSR